MSLSLQDETAGETLVLDRIRPERNERRFYALSIGVDLFGNIHLFRNWGRIGTGGRVRIDVCSGMGDAISALEELAHAKRRRGYGARRVIRPHQ
jgi:predicted DNA-binding WGR domain protein